MTKKEKFGYIGFIAGIAGLAVICYAGHPLVAFGVYLLVLGNNFDQAAKR